MPIQCPIIVPPEIPTKSCRGKTCYVDDDHYLRLAARAPLGSTIYARGREEEHPSILTSVSLHWRDEWGQLKICRRSVWGKIDPFEAWKQLHEHMHDMGARWHATPGGVAGALIDRWTRDGMADENQGHREVSKWPRALAYAPYSRQIREWMRLAQHGGAMRVRRTYADDAIVIDLSEAYAHAMTRIPVGRPQLYTRLTDRDIVRLAKMHSGAVEALVIPSGPITALPSRSPESRIVTWPAEPFTFRGSLLELATAIELGAATIDEWARGYLLSHHTDTIARVLETQLKPIVDLELYKQLYRAMWPNFDVRAGWIGQWGEVTEGSCSDHSDPDLHWTWSGQDLAGSSQALQRPDIAGEITARVRALLMRYWLALPSEQVHACMVDALVIDRDLWLWRQGDIQRIAVDVGQTWAAKEESAGMYLGAYPGQYLCGRRSRLSGIETSQQTLSLLAQQMRRLYREVGRPEFGVRRVRAAAGDETWEGTWKCFEVPEDRPVKVAGRW